MERERGQLARLARPIDELMGDLLQPEVAAHLMLQALIQLDAHEALQPAPVGVRVDERVAQLLVVTSL